MWITTKLLVARDATHGARRELDKPGPALIVVRDEDAVDV